MIRCRCGELFAPTLDGRHRHKVINGHTPAPVTPDRLTGTRWDRSAARVEPRKGRRRPW